MSLQIATLESRQNPRYRALLKLLENPHRASEPLVVVEGDRELERASMAGHTPRDVYLCDTFFPKAKQAHITTLLASWQQQGTRLFSLTASLFEKLSYREHPDGLIGLVQRWEMPLSLLPLRESPLLCVAEGVEKPGNLGALIRTLEGSGATGLILCEPRVSPFNAGVVRASQGALFSLPIAIASNAEAHQFLTQQRITPIATSPSAKSLFWETDLTGPVALLLGSESTGLSSFWLSQAPFSVRIPLSGQSDSLNVTTAGTLVLYEALRQRWARG